MWNVTLVDDSTADLQEVTANRTLWALGHDVAAAAKEVAGNHEAMAAAGGGCACGGGCRGAWPVCLRPGLRGARHGCGSPPRARARVRRGLASNRHWRFAVDNGAWATYDAYKLVLYGLVSRSLHEMHTVRQGSVKCVWGWAAGGGGRGVLASRGAPPAP